MWLRYLSLGCAELKHGSAQEASLAAGVSPHFRDLTDAIGSRADWTTCHVIGLRSNTSSPDYSAMREISEQRHRVSARRESLLALAAGAPAILYLFYVFHFSVDVPRSDDWDEIPLVALALHGHLTIGAFWSEYVAGRPFVARLIVVAFGRFDHLDEKSILVFCAGTFILSFLLLLVLFRSYLGRRLNTLPVLSLGLVWFSLGDPWNTFWASAALAVYPVVFLFVTMTYFLLVPRRNESLFFALGIVAAVAASLTYLQGFVLWPLGVICLLWTSPLDRRAYYKSAIWVSAAVVTVVIYFRGYSGGGGTCVLEGGKQGDCSLTFGLFHPGELLRYLVVLVGNVIPRSASSIRHQYLGFDELVGTAICVIACFVAVQSLRERRRHVSPLPLLLIAFAFLFDLMVSLGHLGEGLLSAGDDRFTLPNFILLAGIICLCLGARP